MKFSRLGTLALLAIAVLFSANCSYINKVLARKNLVEGSIAYRDRKFQRAEELFRRAADRDPNGTTFEGRTALVFLARTLHSQYIGNREATQLAEEAIATYKRALAIDKNDQASYKAVASLYENLGQNDNWQAWVNGRANDTSILPQNRADALVSLAAKQNTCANEVTDTANTKKTVKKDGKDVFQFVKPEDPAELARLQQCVAAGTQLISQAVALEPDAVKNAKNLNPKSMTDEQLKTQGDLFKVFESVRSYNASLKVQASRLAEMEGRNDDRDRLKAEADEAKAQFRELSEVGKSIQDELDARKAVADQAANVSANKAAANKR